MDIRDSRTDPLAHIAEFRDVFLGWRRYATGPFPESTLDHLDRLMEEMTGKPGLHGLGELTLQVFNRTRESTLEKFATLVPDIGYNHLIPVFGVARANIPLDHLRPLLAPMKKELEKLTRSGITIVPAFINVLGGFKSGGENAPGIIHCHQKMMRFMVQEGFFTDDFIALVLPDLMGSNGESRETGAGFLCDLLVDRARRNLDALLENSPIPKRRPVRL